MKYFITGTDTDVGKSFISAILAYHLEASYWKPIQTGGIKDSSFVQALSSCPIFPEHYYFSYPASPHISAALEGKEINLEEINLPESSSPLVVEGAGGILVPLNKEHTMLDLAEKLAMPVIIVARAGLGTINHTWLTINMLQTRNIQVKGVILNGEKFADNKEAIEHYTKIPVIAEVPKFSELNSELVKNLPAGKQLRSILL